MSLQKNKKTCKVQHFENRQGQGAGGPRLFAKKKNASALWRMMANEEIVMETVMLTITINSTIN